MPADPVGPNEFHPVAHPVQSVSDAVAEAQSIRYGFSGSRHLDERGRTVVASTLASRFKAVPAHCEFTTGVCVGVDSFAGQWLWRFVLHGRHRVIVPADRSRVDWWWTHRAIREAEGDSGVEVIEMPSGTTYRDRNVRIVEYSDRLLAFPEHGEDDPRSARSGTWQTIRLAEHYGVPVEVRVLDQV